jgi:hypothetical protein
MKIGLIDVDGHNFPNLALMKISAYIKQKGDTIGFYEPLLSGKLDICYMSKIFTFTPDYKDTIRAKVIIKGGTGYNVSSKLPSSIEHVYPDYGLYGIQDTAYGFLTRGCFRTCPFCIVSPKEGPTSHKVADLSEFWQGQPTIKLLDPNLLAYEGHEELLDQLAKSGAFVDFTQGLDARLLTHKILEKIKMIKIKMIHFSMDNYDEHEIIIEKLKMFKRITCLKKQKVSVYVLCNFNTKIEEDLERINAIRELGLNPFVMLYNKEQLPPRHILLRLQRWVNNKFIFNAVKDFYKYGNNSKIQDFS